MSNGKVHDEVVDTIKKYLILNQEKIMDEDRLKHSLAVANKMLELNNGNNNEEVFLIGYLHDIGYQFFNDKVKHNKVGGEILKNSRYDDRQSGT